MTPELTAKILMAVVAGTIGWILAPGRSKAQWVRLLDVFVYGPFLLAVAFYPSLLTMPGATMLMIFMGVSTITYNGRNWLRQ